MLSVVLVLAILALPLILAQAASVNQRNARRSDLAPVRVRVEAPRIERRRSR